MANELFFRRGNRERLPPLKTGEPALCTDTQEVFVGCGEDTIQLETVPDYELVTLTHNLNCYPKVLVLLYQYGAGLGGAGETPAGGTNAITVNNRVKYTESQITIYVSKSVALPDKAKTVNKVSDHEYTITNADTPDCIYIRLILM